MHYVKIFRPKKRILVCDICRGSLRKRGFKYVIEKQKIRNQQCEICGEGQDGTVSEKPSL